MSDKTTTAQRDDLKKDVLEMADAIKKDITLDVKTGAITPSEGIYAKLLPASLTTEIIGEVQEFHANLFAAGLLAVGELATPAMKKHKELDRVTLSLPAVGKDHIDFQFNRSSQVPDRNADGPQGVKEKFGTSTVGYSMYATKPNGNLGKVKRLLSEQAHKALGASA